MKSFISSVFLLLVFPLLLVSVVQSAEIKDGAWNGKPWDKEKLMKGVKAGDADALAEWSYCSHYSRLDIRYDTKNMLAYAKKAADKGSALGVYMVGHCYDTGCGVKFDKRVAFKHFMKSKDMGHPLGKWKFHVCQRLGLGMKQDLTNAVEKMEESLEEGVGRAYTSLAVIYHRGYTGEVNLPKAAKYLSDGLNKTEDMSVVMDICGLGRNSGLLRHLPKEDVALAWKRLGAAAELGNVFCRFLCTNLALDQVLENGDEVHKHIQDCIEIVNLDAMDRRVSSTPEIMHQRLLRAVIYGLHYRGIKEVDMNYKDYRILAGICYRGNTKDDFVKVIHAESMLKMKNGMLIGKASEEDEAVAVEILRKIARNNHLDHRPHHMLGSYFCRKYMKWGDVDKKFFERGMAHNIYHSKCPFAAFCTADYYFNGKNAKDLARAKAAAMWALEVNSGWYKNKLNEWLKVAEKEMTAEQKKEAERLTKEGFPHADVFRKKAFQDLKKFGDMPEDAPFDGKYEESSIELDKEELLEIVKMLICLPDAHAGAVAGTKDARSEVLEMYWRGDDLSEKHLKVLVNIFMDGEKLPSLLDTYKGGEFAEKAKSMKELLGNEYKLNPETSRFPAHVGWYLTMEKEKVTAHPLVTKLVEAKGGLRSGDVMLSLYGESLKYQNARNAFVRLTKLWPAKYPLKLKVIRNKNTNEQELQLPKTDKADVEITLK